MKKISFGAFIIGAFFLGRDVLAEEDPLLSAFRISAAGMQAQSERLKVISQNLANGEVAGASPEDEPYRRKIIFFHNIYDEQAKTFLVKILKIDEDKSQFEMRYQPEHPAADRDGLVRYPNVNKIIEIADAKEAQTSFEANATSLEITKTNRAKILELMK